MKKSRCNTCNVNYYGEICTNCNKLTKNESIVQAAKPIVSDENPPQIQPFVSSNVPENRFIASISNGKTIFEDIIVGEKSAWMRLKDYCKTNSVKITNLRMQVDGTTYHLPSKAAGYSHLAFKSFDSNGREEDKKGIGYVTRDRKIMMLWKILGKNDIEIEEIEYKEGPCIMNEDMSEISAKS